VLKINQTLLQILTYVKIFLDVYNVIILIRAVLTYLNMDESKIGVIYKILAVVTEPVVGPVRTLLYKSQVVKAFPMDMTFIVVYILISVIRTYLITLGA